MDKVMTHDELVALAVERLRYRYDLIATEFTPYKQAITFDFIGLSRLRRELRIIECKANRANFLADKKWHRYLPYCTHLAFLGAKEVFSKDELPSEIGVIRPRWVKQRKPYWVKEEAWTGGKFEWYYERGCRQLHEVAEYEYLTVLEGFIGQYMLCSWNCQKRGQKPRYSYE